MIRDGLLPPSGSGGMRDPRREDGPLPGAKEPFREASLLSTTTFGGSTSLGAPGAA